jgi:hypothetical protein
VTSDYAHHRIRQALDRCGYEVPRMSITRWPIGASTEGKIVRDGTTYAFGPHAAITLGRLVRKIESIYDEPLTWSES